MRILVFSWRDPRHPLAGGAEQVMHEHMKGWVKAGHKVTLFSSSFKNLKNEEVIDDIKIIRSGYQYLGVQIMGFWYYLKNRNSYDLVVDQFHGLPFFTPLYVSCPKLAVIQETARKVWFLNPLPWPFNWVIGALGYFVEPFIFLFYKNTKFMTGSQSAKNDVIKLGGVQKKNITIVPHGVIVPNSQLSILNFQSKNKIKTVIYLGVLSKDKGIEDAIKCFSLLNKMDSFQFLVVGKPETRAYLNKVKKLVKGLRITTGVKFFGYVNQKKKFELLAKAHVLVNPSIHEGWGLVNIEANAMGTPVVAYNVSGSIDSVKNGASGILCQGNTPEELAKNINEILRDAKKYHQFRNGALSWSKNFSWSKSTKLSLDLLERVSS